ncbi:S9 family peptidase [Albibacterium bauzanense]|uniref:Dipeptidyl-peptidase-4 n=1 Tax=Albibacterium bauzanense TaxID=653929 RepID=A0A4R1LUW9_9SPHI|nr:S9 family peptidase [Albibacterium bauzanense]TCK80973.1 dipeptidyl-peptidase-4 [Albibacterium bauzanense]
MNKFIFIFFLLGNYALAQTPKPITLEDSKKITLEDIYKNNTFKTNVVAGFRSMNDGKSYVSIETNPITKERFVARRNYSDGKISEELFSEKDLTYNNIKLPIGTDFSPDEKKVLIAYQSEKIYRYSTKAFYYVLDLQTKKISPVSNNKEKQLYATFSPDGSKVGFVRGNDLFYTDLASGEEVQITHDGKHNEIINGGTDWVYQEEFSFTSAFFWSPDSKQIAFYRFDETEVKEFSMTMFTGLYPSEYKFKYPKAGEKNSTISIHVYNLANKNTSTVDIGSEKDQYIPRIKWTQDPNILCVLRMNRHQNQLEYLLWNEKKQSTNIILTETDKYYIDINDDLTFLKDNKHFLLTSEQDGYNHIYLYNIDGKLIQQITKGNWEVTKLYGINEETGTLYFQSTESSPLQRDIYSINLSGNKKKKISISEGTNAATFSADFSYYVLNYSSVNTPPYITLNSNKGIIRVLEDNHTSKEVSKEYGISPRDFFSFTTSEGADLNGYMIKPTNFNKDTKYPVLMFVYGGPGSQNVVNSWTHNYWFDYLAQKGYLIVCVDNRGTGFRGAEFKKMTYLELGKYETIDQIEAAKWLGEQSYVDKDRIGIWGWSYGGYMASLAITKGADVFKTAIAVAPVTNWRFYDSIYTERYMRTPQENSSGYDNNSPISFANKLKGNFLLIHGTADDNVHFQNSIMLSEALINANKPFDQAYYPNKNHSINGGNTSLHLYTKMSEFIFNKL